MPQFDVSFFLSQIFWLTIVFCLLYFIISKLIVPKAESIITKRSLYIEDNINHARTYKEEADQLALQKKELLEEVNNKVEEMRDQAIELLNLKRTQKVNDLNLNLDLKRKSASIEIERYIHQFHHKDTNSYINLSAFIIEKITNKPADLELLKKIKSKK